MNITIRQLKKSLGIISVYMNNQSQELIELIFNLKHIPGSSRFTLVEDHGFLSIEDCISDIQNELEFETSLANIIYWIKFGNEISMMFALIGR